MIEKCIVCSKIHEVEGDVTIGGVMWKTCPEIPPNFFFQFNPKDWGFLQDEARRNLTGFRYDPTLDNSTLNKS